MAVSRNRPAAVLREGDPGAESALHLVPSDAEMVMVGDCTTGYTVPPRRTGYTAAQLQAARRIEEVRRLLEWRASAGEVPSRADVVAALDVLTDATRFFASGKLSSQGLRNHFPSRWSELVADELIGQAIATPRPNFNGVVSNREAGLTLALRLVEVLAIEAEAGGQLFQLLGTDESDAERDERRAARERQMDRELKRRKRAEAKAAESHTTVRMPSNHRGHPDKPNVTFGDGSVISALRAGAVTSSDVAAATGKTVAASKMALRRLMDAGYVLKVARGRYAAQASGEGMRPAESVPSQGPAVVGPSVDYNVATSYSGPETPLSCLKSASEVASKRQALPRAEVPSCGPDVTSPPPALKSSGVPCQRRDKNGPGTGLKWGQLV